jgi:hypothetical protein
MSGSFVRSGLRARPRYGATALLEGAPVRGLAWMFSASDTRIYSARPVRLCLSGPMRNTRNGRRAPNEKRDDASHVEV